MEDREEIFIRRVDCLCEEDVADRGIVPSKSSWDWNCDSFHLEDHGFRSVLDALDKVSDTLCFDRTKDWIAWTEDGERGRFEATAYVDADGSEATERDVEMWKRGKKRLWYCTVSARLAIRTVRDFTEDEVRNVGFETLG